MTVTPGFSEGNHESGNSNKPTITHGQGGLLVLHRMESFSVTAGGERNPRRATRGRWAQAGKLAEVDKFMERQIAEKKIAGGIVIVRTTARSASSTRTV